MEFILNLGIKLTIGLKDEVIIKLQMILKNIIGDSYGVNISRVDAFPNGYSAYKVTIDS